MLVFNNSRYAQSRSYTDSNGVVVLFQRNRFKFDKLTVTNYRWIAGDTLEGLAYRFYNDKQLWWVILEANPTYHDELDFVPGKTIIIPSREDVMKWLTLS